ncbi:hypothetical protein GS904_07120 [Rhodococcus hoagii]|nr:hypothetical protein [Prescottella equi]
MNSSSGSTSPETRPESPPDVFSRHFDSARDAVYEQPHTRAKQLDRAAYGNVLEHLQPDRVGHGVRSVEDEHLLEFLASREIPLEVALTSNGAHIGGTELQSAINYQRCWMQAYTLPSRPMILQRAGRACRASTTPPSLLLD